MFHSFLHERLGIDRYDKSYRQAFLLLSIIYLATFVISFYIIYNLVYTKLYYIIALEVISLLVIYLSWYFLVRRHNISLSANLLLFTVAMLTFLFILDQQHTDYAFAQAVMFPPLAIYLKGLRTGTYISLTYILSILGIAFFGMEHYEAMVFTTTSFTNLAFTYAVVIVLIYYFELSRVEAFEIIHTSHQKLVDYQDNLEQKVQEAIQLKQEHEKLLIQQSKMATMGEMVASISHQWKQPLQTSTSIITAAKVRHELGKEVALEELFEELTKQIRYMDRTIVDFTRFLKPDRTKEFFSLNEAINDAHTLLDHQLKQRNIALINTVKDAEILIEGYQSEFSQALLNILSNAIDSITAHIEAGKRSSIEGKITIKATFNNNYLLLCILDNGTGIPEEDQEKIFQPYTSGKGEYGTGLGLYMAKIIIDAHGGKITTYNTEEGACFELGLSAIKKHT